MPSRHNNLQVRDMQEKLKDNVNNLEYQLTNANNSSFL